MQWLVFKTFIQETGNSYPLVQPSLPTAPDPQRPAVVPGEGAKAGKLILDTHMGGRDSGARATSQNTLSTGS